MRHKGDPNIDIEETTQAGHEQLPALFIADWLAPARPAVALAHERQHAAGAGARIGRAAP